MPNYHEDLKNMVQFFNHTNLIITNSAKSNFTITVQMFLLVIVKLRVS